MRWGGGGGQYVQSIHSLHFIFVFQGFLRYGLIQKMKNYFPKIEA